MQLIIEWPIVSTCLWSNLNSAYWMELTNKFLRKVHDATSIKFLYFFTTDFNHLLIFFLNGLLLRSKDGKCSSFVAPICLSPLLNSILNGQFVEIDCPREYFIFMTFELNCQHILLNAIYFNLLVSFYQSLWWPFWPASRNISSM